MRAGASLDQLTGAPMPVPEFLALATRVTAELAALHARGAIGLRETIELWGRVVGQNDRTSILG